ncbi:MAG: glycosyltransferase family 2 protein [Phycisphaeraceae bacterium]
MNTLTVIVNYRCADLTIDALRTVADEVTRYREQINGDLHVVVTDNASGDDAVQRLEQARTNNNWHDWLTILPLPKNGGFAYGNNEAIRWANTHRTPADFIHLLNPDTLLRDNAIVELVRFMQTHPEVGVAGSRLEDPDGTVQTSAFREPGILSEFEGSINLGLISNLLSRYRVAPAPPTTSSPTDWVAGASMIVRREVIDTIGLLDEDYFMYFEELDWICSAARNGWPCWYVVESRVVHLVGQVSGVTNTRASDQTPASPPKRKRIPKYYHEARRHYWLKNHGRLKKLIADTAVIIGTLLWWTHMALRGKKPNSPPHFLADFIAFHLLGSYPDRR